MLLTVTHVKMESLVMKQLIPQTMTAVSVLALALAVGGCGSSSGGDDTMPVEPTPAQKQAMCESGGGRWNADMTCTSAEDLAQERATMQRADIKMKIMAAQTAVNAVNNDSTDAEVGAAEMAVAAAKMAISDAADVPAEEKAANTGTVGALETQLSTAKMARMDAMDEAEMAEKMAMMKTAMKLHMGIGAMPIGGTGEDVRTAASDADGVISVTMGSAAAVPLAEDKKAMVADLHGWKGKRHTAEPTGDAGTYEAMVYSNAMPTEGKKFGSAAAVTADGDYQYQLTNGELSIDTNTAGVAGRVAGSSFDQSAGAKMFKLGDNAVRVVLSGNSHHGVSGTYYCTPDSGQMCTATVAASGFTLTGGTWAFKPSNAEAKVSEMMDTVYASYGWWLHKSEDGMTYTASAFATERGTVTAAANIGTLRGTAKYMGGAVGKYALYSSTGGTNDAGHFTAKATLDADFNTDMITGTIDNFMGADGQSRDWSVELKKSGVGDTGVILGADGTGDPMMTVWTIDGTAAAAAGRWSGTLFDNGTDGVPKVGTGTFHSEYSTSGRMVGAFGVDKQ